MGKYLRYLRYVIRHKWFVFLACLRLGIIWRGITHDLSKLLPSEFIPYARYFYGNYQRLSVPKFVEDDFDFAWLLHQKRNPHHWQWWILREDDGGTKRLLMSVPAVKEMVADWIGAGRAISGRRDPTPWYQQNREKILLHDTTRRIVERMLIEREGF